MQRRVLGRRFAGSIFDNPLGFIGGIAKGAVAGATAASVAKRLWDTDIREPTMRLNSVLEERSYVDFYFPNLGIGDLGRTGRILREPVYSENDLLTTQLRILSRETSLLVVCWVGSS